MKKPLYHDVAVAAWRNNASTMLSKKNCNNSSYSSLDESLPADPLFCSILPLEDSFSDSDLAIPVIMPEEGAGQQSNNLKRLIIDCVSTFTPSMREFATWLTLSNNQKCNEQRGAIGDDITSNVRNVMITEENGPLVTLEVARDKPKNVQPEPQLSSCSLNRYEPASLSSYSVPNEPLESNAEVNSPSPGARAQEHATSNQYHRNQQRLDVPEVTDASFSQQQLSVYHLKNNDHNLGHPGPYSTLHKNGNNNQEQHNGDGIVACCRETDRYHVQMLPYHDGKEIKIVDFAEERHMFSGQEVCDRGDKVTRQTKDNPIAPKSVIE